MTTGTCFGPPLCAQSHQWNCGVFWRMTRCGFDVAPVLAVLKPLAAIHTSGAAVQFSCSTRFKGIRRHAHASEGGVPIAVIAGLARPRLGGVHDGELGP
jgi:hypothetical protein